MIQIGPKVNENENLGSIWYHSEPSEVPYSPNQYLDRGLSLITAMGLQPNSGDMGEEGVKKATKNVTSLMDVPTEKGKRKNVSQS